MKVTEVRIKLTGETDDRLLAFCSVTFDDCFVIRDLKIIDGSSGPFVAMPSRKLTSHCPKCRCKNHLRSNFCNQCGRELRRDNGTQNRDGGGRLYADIAHPINAGCRELIQRSVIEEFDQELNRSKQPGYQPRYDFDFENFDYSEPAALNTEDGSGKPPHPVEDKSTSGGIEPEKNTRDASSGSDSKRTRRDVPHTDGPKASKQPPGESEKSAKQDSDDDQFGAGILD